MKIKIADKDFELQKPKLKHWIQLEEKGINRQDFEKGEFSFKAIRDILHMALSVGDDSITSEWVGDNIDFENIDLITKIINFIVPKGSNQKKKD